MSDIKKKLTLSAELDTSKIASQLKELKKLASDIKIDTKISNTLTGDFKSLAKVFADEVKKNLKGLSVTPRTATRAATKAEPKPVSYEATAADIRKYKQDQAFGKHYTSSTQYQKDFEFMQNQRKKPSAQELLARKRAEQTGGMSEDKIRQAMQGNYPNKDLDKDFEFMQNQRKKPSAQELLARKIAEETGLSPDKLKAYKTGEAFGGVTPSQAESVVAGTRLQKKLAEEKSRLQEKVDEASEKRQLSSARKVAEAFKNFIKEGDFDLFNKEQKQDLQRASELGIRGASDAYGSGRFNRLMGNRAAMAMRAAGTTLAGATVAVQGSRFAGNFVGERETYQREQRGRAARREFEQITAARQGRFVEGAITNRARKEDVGFLDTVGAGLRAFGNITKNLNIAQNYRDEITQIGQQEAAAQISENQPLVQAIQGDFIPSLGARRAARRGGGVGLGRIQAQGAGMGLGIDESLQAFQRARGSLGNTSAESIFSNLLKTRESTNIGIGQQARFIEQLQGVGSSIGNVQSGAAAQERIIKKAMAAGLDASKTSKFLQTTSSFIETNLGVANQDTNVLTNQLSALANSFATQAGRDQVMNADLQRAQNTQQLIQNMSASQGGISQIGELSALMPVLRNNNIQLSGMDLLNLQGFSAKATKGDIEKFLKQRSPGISDEQLRNASGQIMDINQSPMRNIENIVGGNKSAAGYLFRQETGMATEDVEATRRILEDRDRAGKIIEGRVGSQILPEGGAEKTAEFGIQVQQAGLELKSFNTGLRNTKIVTDQLQTAFENLQTALENVNAEARKFEMRNDTRVSAPLEERDSMRPRTRGDRGN